MTAAFNIRLSRALAFWIFIIGVAKGEQTQKTPLTDDNIGLAVDEWFSNREGAKSKYGAIESWDTSQVTDMQKLFQDKSEFNDDISKWNTSSVTSMAYLFNGATSFNQDLDLWDTRKVKHMDAIFNFATSFNGNISTWLTESLRSMDYAFSHATAFNSDISSWQTANVKYMALAFWNATSFSHDLSNWTIANVKDMGGMFYNASAFNHALCWEGLVEHSHVSKLFCGSQGTLDPKCVDTELLAVVNEQCPKEKKEETPDTAGSQVATATPTKPQAVDKGDETMTSSESTAGNTTQPSEAPKSEDSNHDVPAGSSVETIISTPQQTTTEASESGSEDSSTKEVDTPSVSAVHSTTSQSSKKTDILFYLAFAFVAACLLFVTFSFFIVMYKRRQVKESYAQRRVHNHDDAATFRGEDSLNSLDLSVV